MDVEVNYRLVQDPSRHPRTASYPGVRPRHAARVPNRSSAADRSRHLRRASRLLQGQVDPRLLPHGDPLHVWRAPRRRLLQSPRRRDEKARESEAELNRLLNPHGLQVVKVVPDEFQLLRRSTRRSSPTRRRPIRKWRTRTRSPRRRSKSRRRRRPRPTPTANGGDRDHGWVSSRRRSSPPKPRPSPPVKAAEAYAISRQEGRRRGVLQSQQRRAVDPRRNTRPRRRVCSSSPRRSRAPAGPTWSNSSTPRRWPSADDSRRALTPPTRAFKRSRCRERVPPTRTHRRSEGSQR